MRHSCKAGGKSDEKQRNRGNNPISMIEFFRDIYYNLYLIFQETFTFRILVYFFELSLKILPYFLTSILIQVGLSRLIRIRKQKIVVRYKTLAVLIAAVIGLLSPLPTFAAVPIGLSFLSLGVPFNAVIAFIIASPLMNPSIFFLTITQLGIKIALARVIATLIIACGGGFLSFYFLKPATHTAEKFSPQNQRPFFVDFYRTFFFLGKYFVVALLLSSAVKALLPPDFITKILGPQSQKSILVAIALGVPLYSCGGAAIPLVDVLMDMGMNDGAVLAFFIAGPATKLETIYIFLKCLGSRALFFYLILTGSSAYLLGIMFLYLFG